MERLFTYLAIGLGSGLGGMGRFWISGVVARHFGETFPWGTLVINVTGSFVIGGFVALTGPDGRYLVSPRFGQFFTLGLCGGYTTFSSFSLQTLNLARDGQWGSASANIILSVAACLLAVWLGHEAGQLINR